MLLVVKCVLERKKNSGFFGVSVILPAFLCKSDFSGIFTVILCNLIFLIGRYRIDIKIDFWLF